MHPRRDVIAPTTRNPKKKGLNYHQKYSNGSRGTRKNSQRKPTRESWNRTQNREEAYWSHPGWIDSSEPLFHKKLSKRTRYSRQYKPTLQGTYDLSLPSQRAHQPTRKYCESADKQSRLHLIPRQKLQYKEESPFLDHLTWTRPKSNIGAEKSQHQGTYYSEKSSKWNSKLISKGISMIQFQESLTTELIRSLSQIQHHLIQPSVNIAPPEEVVGINEVINNRSTRSKRRQNSSPLLYIEGQWESIKKKCTPTVMELRKIDSYSSIDLPSTKVDTTFQQRREKEFDTGLHKSTIIPNLTSIEHPSTPIIYRSRWTPHSIKVISSSMLFLKGRTITDIVRLENWSSTIIFKQAYWRPMVKTKELPTNGIQLLQSLNEVLPSNNEGTDVIQKFY